MTGAVIPVQDPNGSTNGPGAPSYVGMNENGDACSSSSIVFSLSHTAGSLANALKPFEVM